jgi:acyl-CoA synthetase (NDP forming)
VQRDLSPLFEPRSVAVVGVSSDRAKWGNWLARGAVRGAHRRSVFLVGRSGGELLGHHVHRSLADLPEPPELVVLTVPAHGVEETVDEALAAGARALVVIAAGLGEAGGEGCAREQAIVERTREAGAILLGPNCLGVFDARAELELAFGELPAGSIGFVSQSGNIGLEVGLLLADYGLGFSRFASIGNQADLDATDLLVTLAAHEPTEVIAVYCEDFRDGRAFAEAARTAGKPVILLTVGRSPAAVRAARSHTGSLTSDLDAVDAACRAAGVHRVETPRELVDLALALRSPHRPRGPRLAIVSDGGGYGAVAADLCARHGLELPVLRDATQSALRAELPPTASTGNPVDLAGAGEQDTFSFARTTCALLADDELDAVLFTAYYGGYSEESDELRDAELEVARQLAAAADASRRMLVVQTMYWDSPPARALREARVPVYRAIESAVASLARLVANARTKRPVPALPPAATPSLTRADYTSARAALAAAGIDFAEARTVRTRYEAVGAADELGYPVVLKALGVLHKSDAGGVALGLRDGRAVALAADDLTDRLAPPELSVERAEDTAAGLELIVGARRDLRFGPIVLVGAGGVLTEVLQDVAVALAPVDEHEALALVRSLRCAPVLAGTRGRPPLDAAAAARAVAALSRFAAERPEVSEVEVNPLLVRTDGAIALDARIVLEAGIT